MAKKSKEGKTEPRPASEASRKEAKGVSDPVSPQAESGQDSVTEASRRDFLSLSGKLVVGACGLGALGVSARMATPDFVAGPPDRFALGAVSDFKVNTQTWIRERDLFVLRDGRGFGVLSARCTHLGCTVRRVAEGFACPCHGARFDSAGQVLVGPARDPLPWFELRLGLDGRLWVDVSSTVPPGTVALADLEASG